MTIVNDDTHNYPFRFYNWWLKRFDTQFNKSINRNSIKSPKLLNQQIRKRYDKTLGTCVINISMSPSFTGDLKG